MRLFYEALGDDVSVERLETSSRFKVGEQFPEIQVAAVVCVLRGVVTPDTPGDAVLPHVKARGIRNVARAVGALEALLELLSSRLDGFVGLRFRHLGKSRLIVSLRQPRNEEFTLA